MPLSSNFLQSLRALLLLGRISNLPTVWSNCLAGWWLGTNHNSRPLPFLLVGGTLLYVGGMFWNDAFDAVFDREHRPERPIPCGSISRRAVWLWGWALLILGVLCLFQISRAAAGIGLLLAGFIVLYDAVHKHIAFAPVIMGACRFLLYVLAAASTGLPVTGTAIWCGLALAAYIVGLSFFARQESFHGPLHWWPVLLLGGPLILSLLLNVGPYRQNALLLAAVLSLWCIKSMRYAVAAVQRDIGRAVSGLLAGIVFVDWVAVADASRSIGFIFLFLFALALLLQKIVPAT